MNSLPCPSTGPDYRGHGPDAAGDILDNLDAAGWARVQREHALSVLADKERAVAELVSKYDQLNGPAWDAYLDELRDALRAEAA